MTTFRKVVQPFTLKTAKMRFVVAVLTKVYALVPSLKKANDLEWPLEASAKCYDWMTMPNERHVLTSLSRT
jgi:hypothetical protein